MKTFFTIVRLTVIAITLVAGLGAAAVTPDGRTHCKVRLGPVGLGYRTRCEGSAKNWYARFPDFVLDLYDLERRGLMRFDWEQIKASCTDLHVGERFCATIGPAK